VICNARNSAVDARTRFSIAADFARSSNLPASMPAASAAISVAIFQSSDVFAFAQRGPSKREPDRIISEAKILCRFGQQFAPATPEDLDRYQSVLSMNAERIIIPLRR